MRPRIIAVMLGLGAALLLGGCATRGSLAVDCPGFAGQLKTLQPSPLRKTIQAETGNGRTDAALAANGDADIVYLRGKMVQMRANKTAAERTGPGALLILSGGGQWGSFGASFLTRQPRTGEDPAEHLPDYDVVTGVSTGGLQALFMAVGDERAFAALRQAYGPASENEIVDRNSFLLIPVTGSQAGLKPLLKRAHDALCSDAELARAQPDCLLTRLAASPRVTLIGFVEARSGDFKFVDVRDFFAGRSLREARGCIAGAALASAAMPVFFQQVQVDGVTYFDGGVRLSLFIGPLDRALAAMPGAAPAPVYLLRNGPTDVVVDQGADKPARSPIASALRAEAILVNQTELNSIEAMRIADIARPIYFASADRFRGFVDAEGNARVCRKTDPKAIFDPAFMDCLAEMGTFRATRPRRWRALPALK